MITQEKIDRINFLARKSREEGLTEEEAKEQKALRAEYVAAFRKSLETQLDSTVIVRPDGTREKIERISAAEDYISSNTSCKIVKVRDFGEIGIVEVDNVNEILSDNKYNQINDALKRQGFGKVALNLSQIDDNESITIDYNGDSFLYQLPFTINLEHTKEHTENIISCDEEKIELDKITIFENGLIEGHDLESYDLALDKFMETLPKLRRNIR